MVWVSKDWGLKVRGTTFLTLRPDNNNITSLLTPPPLITGISAPLKQLMSGIEIAGVLLGAFPLIISGLEHWRDVAKVRGFWRHVRKEHTACVREIQFHAILYKRNLKNLLLPTVGEPSEIDNLLNDPGGPGWQSKPLQERFAGRLLESCDLYMNLVSEMNEVAQELRKELCLDSTAVQNKLALPEARKQQRTPSPQPQTEKHSRLAQARSKFEYEAFRLKFSLNEPIREGLLKRMKECNERLEKLLSTSDIVSARESADVLKTTGALEVTLRKAWRKSDHLFKAIQNAWQCSCEQYHFANLRLEHRTLPEICFEVILTFVAPGYSAKSLWSWRRLQCGQPSNCTLSDKLAQLSIHSNSSHRAPTCTPTRKPSSTTTMRKQVAFSIPNSVAPNDASLVIQKPEIKLCQRLHDPKHSECVGTVGHNEEAYHLHSSSATTGRDQDTKSLNLDHILSSDFEGYVSRRQRYDIALLLASSVAQLQFTPWLSTDLAKADVLFFPCVKDTWNVSFHEPFIRQGFAPQSCAIADEQGKECNFASLGILLLELCFGRRLEDHPLRKKHPLGDGEAKRAFDLMAAITWSHHVSDEGGEDYASAVKWCLITSARKANDSWRSEIVKNVIRPLEKCQEHFKTVAAC